MNCEITLICLGKAPPPPVQGPSSKIKITREGHLQDHTEYTISTSWAIFKSLHSYRANAGVPLSDHVWGLGKLFVGVNPHILRRPAIIEIEITASKVVQVLVSPEVRGRMCLLDKASEPRITLPPSPTTLCFKRKLKFHFSER
jgi:hypothetical protein